MAGSRRGEGRACVRPTAARLLSEVTLAGLGLRAHPIGIRVGVEDPPPPPHGSGTGRVQGSGFRGWVWVWGERAHTARPGCEGRVSGSGQKG
ncbi:hypothetical protein T484DRAFT_1953573 [Baffinella frigidus]|nr:hypothetical protein T484DRAFT_1953573 [Cryptophyta sp. CCMP2293]